MEAALDWGDIDVSCVNIWDADDVWNMATTGFASYMDIEGINVTIATLDLGRGATYVCADTHSDRYVYDYEVLEELAPNDWEALRGYGFDC